MLNNRFHDAKEEWELFLILFTKLVIILSCFAKIDFLKKNLIQIHNLCANWDCISSSLTSKVSNVCTNSSLSLLSPYLIDNLKSKAFFQALNGNMPTLEHSDNASLNIITHSKLHTQTSVKHHAYQTSAKNEMPTCTWSITWNSCDEWLTREKMT
jgi:hypothetical protein